MDEQLLSRLLSEALLKIPDPNEGLPEPAIEFALKIVPAVNVDLLVKDKDRRTLLAWRSDEYGQGWHIPGGMIRFGEMASDRIHAVADLELGADVSPEPQPCFVLEQHSPRGHFISLLYRCTLKSGPLQPSRFADPASPKSGELAWFWGLPDCLYPDHLPYADWLR